MTHLHDYRLLLNAPIGYSKNPLVIRSDVPRIIVDEDFSSPPSARNHSIDKLPPEITAHITNMLNQHDTLSLAYTSKTMATQCFVRLYEKVVVDSHYTQFNKEYPHYHTYINLLYNFKKFIRNRRSQGVKSLHVVSLPDLTNIYDADVSRLLHEFFALLTNLHELVWLLDNFRLEYLRRLPNHACLTRLELNIKYSNYLGELAPGKAVEDNEYLFPNLVTFHIRPFLNLRRLVKLLNNLLVARNSHHVRQSLRSLKLARFDSDTTLLVPPARELANPAALDSTDDDHHEYELDTLEAVFVRSHMGRLNGLIELSLNNMLVSERDAQILSKSVDLTKIRRLELKNVSEYGARPEDDPRRGVLGQLAPQLSQLIELRLDYREASIDTIGPFLHSLENLRSLDMVVRLNDIKKACTDVSAMYMDYGTAISRQKHMEHFCVEIREESSFCDIVVPTPLPIIKSLKNLTNLRSIRLNAGDRTQSVEALLEVLRSLPKLEILDVFGAKAGGAPNLGLGMIHPNVYDEWFKVQHVALLYWRAQIGLRYVRIHKCVFEIYDGVANPRDGIDWWFDSQVRVGWDQSPDDIGRRNGLTF